MVYASPRQPQPDIHYPTLRHHPPHPAHDPHQHQRGQQARAGLIPGGDAVLRHTRRAGLGPRPRARIALTRAATNGRNGGIDFRNQITGHDLQGAHLLADAKGAIIDAQIGPLEAAGDAVLAAAALLGGGGGGGLQLGQDEGGGEGGHFGGGGHPAGQVGFERELVDVAFAVAFARDFVHDVRDGGGEEDFGGVEDAFGAGLPEGGAVGLG